MGMAHQLGISHMAYFSHVYSLSLSGYHNGNTWCLCPAILVQRMPDNSKLWSENWTGKLRSQPEQVL